MIRRTWREMRVVRGGGSVANGPGALAGTIEMTSRSDTGASGEIDGGSRDSLEARGRARDRAGGGVLSLSGRGERGDGFIPVTEDTRGPADEPAPYREWSGRGALGRADRRRDRAAGELSTASTTGVRAAPISAPTAPTAPTPRVRLVGRGSWQWSALGYWQWRNLMSSFASVSPGRTKASARVAAGRRAVARARRKRGAPPADAERVSSCGSAPMRRRTDGESRELLFIRGRRADSAAPGRRRNLDQRGFCRSQRRAGVEYPDRRRAARSLAHQRRPSVRESRSPPGRSCATSMTPRATAGCRPREAACRRRSAAA